MADRVVLTDKLLRAAKPSDKRYDVLDALCPGLLAVVHPSGGITLQLRTRIGAASPIRRAIGKLGQVTVEQARRTARDWIELLHNGTDPKAAQRRARQEAQRAAAHTFDAVFEQFAERKLRTQRRGHQVELAIRRDLLPRFKGWLVSEISHRDIRDAVEQVVTRGAQASAHNCFDAARAIFAFAVERDYIEISPCDRLKRRAIIGVKKARERVLSNDELQAIWRCASRFGYPHGPIWQLLLLTGCRLDEVAGMRWNEIDLARKTWTIPASRYKVGQQHIVPLTEDMLKVLAALPRFRRGDHVFSTTFGETAVNGFSHVKVRLDKRILATLRAMARARGDDPASVQLVPWCNHDIRRTVRTRLAGLRVLDHIAELTIGHSRKGIARMYDLHKYQDEVREALTKWEGLLNSIVAPSPRSDNVVPLRVA